MGYKVEYPDEIAYVFNPMVVRISVPYNSPADKMAIGITKVGGDGMEVVVGAPVFKGVAVMDVSQAVRMLFEKDSFSRLPQQMVYDSPTSIEIKLNISLQGGVFTPKVTCVWGALQTDMGPLIRGDYNDDYNSDFTNMPSGKVSSHFWLYGKPFTVSIPAMAGDVVKYDTDLAGGGTVTTAAKHGIMNVDIGKLVVDRELVIRKYLDMTVFRDIFPKKLYRVEVDYGQCEDKVYLRWVDKKGYYRYWGFDKVADSYQSEKVGAFIENFSRSTNYVEGFNGGDGRQQGWKSQRSVGIVAPLVDEPTWHYLLGVMQSPVVDMYADNDEMDKPRWVKVAVEPGKVARERAVLSDFSAVLLLDEINLQRL